jgi:hypothetical protein
MAALGLGVCSISYDTVEILNDFAERRNVTIPLLADPASHVIRRFGLFNEEAEAGSRGYGMAHPGIFIVDADGVVRERLFEDLYYHRMTMPTVLGRLGVASPAVRDTAVEDVLRVSTVAPQSVLNPGNRVTLFVEVQPARGVHVYGPDVMGGYQGLTLNIARQPYLTVYPPVYPPAHALDLPWTAEMLTGYAEPVRVSVDVALGTRQELAALLETGSGPTIQGTLDAQACDESICWPPQTIRLAWRFELVPPDLERVPEHLQHKPRTP